MPMGSPAPAAPLGSETSEVPEPDEDEWLESLEETVRKVRRAVKPYRGVLLLSFGAITCFAGRRFPYSPLFLRSFAVTGWPAARHAASEVRQRLRAARTAARRELPAAGFASFSEAGAAARTAAVRLQGLCRGVGSGSQSPLPSGGDFDATAVGGAGDMASLLAAELAGLQADLEPAQRAGSALAAVSAELQPSRLAELARGVHAAIVESLSAAMADGADLLGLGFDIGGAVARSVNRFAAPWLHWLVDFAAERSSREVWQLREDRHARQWIQFVVDGACSSLGIGAAFFIEARLLPFANARLGAKTLAEGLCAVAAGGGPPPLEPLRAPPAVRRGWAPAVVVGSLECLFFGAGVYVQFVVGTSGPSDSLQRWARGIVATPTLPTRLLLGYPMLLESWLTAAVAAMRVSQA